MKIGILTMAYKRNYGGILQCYALYNVLQKLEHDVKIIDYQEGKGNNKHPLDFPLINAFLRKLFHNDKNTNKPKTRPLPQEHINTFTEFKSKYLVYTKEVGNEDIITILSQFEAVVVGSDQVWNKLSNKKLYYFCDFDKGFSGLKIAYAPCAVVQSIPFYNKMKLKSLLCDFHAISVRDETTSELVRKLTGQKPQIVLDPTCLYDFNEFANQEPLVKGNYIFTYILGSEISHGHKNVISKIRAKYGDIKVVAAIIPNVSLEVEKFADKVMYNASPDQWVNLIAHSSFVYTDSFHGCMFSIKFHKPFIAYYRDARRSSRLRDLCSMYNLENIIGPNDEVIIKDVDYTYVDSILCMQRNDSLNFIETSLK